MSEKNIIKTARFHHITAGMRFAEFILREIEGLTQTPPLAGQPTILKPYFEKGGKNDGKNGDLENIN